MKQTTAAIFLSVVLGFLFSGCQRMKVARSSRPASAAKLSAVTNLTSVPLAAELKMEWRQPMTNFYTLGPGDLLEIEVLDEPTTRQTVLVGPDGKIYYYLLPGLEVWGLTLAETREKVAQDLATKYLRRDPAQLRLALTLRGLASKQVWLLGRFNAPGVYTLSAPTTILEAIALAGGPATLSSAASGGNGSSAALFSGGGGELADLRRSFVIRRTEVIPIDLHRLLREGDMSQNIYLQPDDFVFLPSRTTRDVYVLGAVRLPTVVKYDDPTSLVSAIAYAGGTVKDAYLSHVAIVRGSLSEPKMAIVDYHDIVHGKANDVRLEPGDIVYVPQSPYRTLTRYADLILDTFVRTIGINEGARAITRQAGPVGVNVPIGP